MILPERDEWKTPDPRLLRVRELEQENAWLLAKLVAVEALCDAAEAGNGTGIWGTDVSTAEIRAAFTTNGGQT